MDNSEMKKQAKERERLEKQQKKEMKKKEREEKKAEQKKNRKEFISSALVDYLQGLPGVEAKTRFDVTYDDAHLLLKQMKGLGLIGVVRTFKIPAEKVICIEMVDETTIEQKKKSVVGRGIAGSILLGPAGMVLGGMSGVGTKEEKKKRTIITISYFGDNEQDIKTILMEEEPGFFSRFWAVKKEFEEKFMKKEELGKEVVL